MSFWSLLEEKNDFNLFFIFNIEERNLKKKRRFEYYTMRLLENEKAYLKIHGDVEDYDKDTYKRVLRNREHRYDIPDNLYDDQVSG